MNKIPLEATIGSAYRFLFTRILLILGTLWLPLLVMAVLVTGILYAAVPHEWLAGHLPQIPEHSGQGPHQIDKDMAVIANYCWQYVAPFMMAMPPIIVIAVVLNAMMMVGLLRLSLGQSKSQFVFFSLGADVWRLVLAMLLFCVLMVLFYVVAIGVAVTVSVVAKPLVPHGAWVAATVVLAIAAMCFPIYATVRLFFFLPAVVVAEHRMGFGRAWELGGGNFWRIFVVMLLIVIPVAIVGGMISNMTIMPILASEFMRLADKPTAPDLSAFFHALPPLIPVFLAIGLLQRIANMGLMAGAIGSAYNALVPKAEEKTSA